MLLREGRQAVRWNKIPPNRMFVPGFPEAEIVTRTVCNPAETLTPVVDASLATTAAVVVAMPEPTFEPSTDIWNVGPDAMPVHNGITVYVPAGM